MFCGEPAEVFGGQMCHCKIFYKFNSNQCESHKYLEFEFETLFNCWNSVHFVDKATIILLVSFVVMNFQFNLLCVMNNSDGIHPANHNYTSSNAQRNFQSENA